MSGFSEFKNDRQNGWGGYVGGLAGGLAGMVGGIGMGGRKGPGAMALGSVVGGGLGSAVGSFIGRKANAETKEEQLRREALLAKEMERKGYSKDDLYLTMAGNRIADKKQLDVSEGGHAFRHGLVTGISNLTPGLGAAGSAISSFESGRVDQLASRARALGVL